MEIPPQSFGMYLTGHPFQIVITGQKKKKNHHERNNRNKTMELFSLTLDSNLCVSNNDKLSHVIASRTVSSDPGECCVLAFLHICPWQNFLYSDHSLRKSFQSELYTF